MARTLRMFESEFPYEGGAGDVTQQDVPDAWFIDKEEAYGSYHAMPVLERSQIEGIGADVAAGMFGGDDSAIPALAPGLGVKTPARRAANTAVAVLSMLRQKPTWPTGIWNGTSWAVATGDAGTRNARIDPHMARIARRFNVALYRITSPGSPAHWVFSPNPQAPAGIPGTVVSLNRSV